ncbi:MAG: hypothetical protein WC655_16080 [Candidatus Hydrogenedentales bacterium]|jgi:phosphate/sulfate permease
MTPGFEHRKPLRTSGMTRLFFAVLLVVLSVSTGASYWQSGNKILLVWSIVCMLAAIVNGVVYFGMRSIVQDEAQAPAKDNVRNEEDKSGE